MKATARVLPAMLVALSIPTEVPAVTWYVDQSGSGDATTIQAGVDLASPGDIVVVLPGTYHEQVDLTTNDLRLIGASGAEATIVDAEPMAYCLRTQGVTQTVLSGLTFTGARGGYDYDGRTSFGVQLSGNAEIRECVFRDNLCDSASAIFGSGSLRVEDTRFIENIGVKYSYPDPGCNAACIYWSGELEVDGCTFERNSGSCYATIMAGGSITIFNSVFRENERWVSYYHGGGLFTDIWGTSTWWIERNIFVRNQGFPILDPGGNDSDVYLRFNTAVDNDPSGPSYPIPALPGSIIRGNVFAGGDVGLHLPEGGGGITVACNDSWGNEVNWEGYDPSGSNGNFSADPLCCDRSRDDFRVTGASPLLPLHNECGVFIGAVPNWCPTVSIESSTWSRIKARYR